MRAKTVFEGVGDKYAARKWHIPDPDEELERKYLDNSIKQDNEMNIVYTFRSGVFIVKNPKDLSNFVESARAIISKTGDLYVVNKNNETHTEIARALDHIGEIKYEDNWWKKYPEEFLTIHRLEKTNSFVMGESNFKFDPFLFIMRGYLSPDDFTEEIDPIYHNFFNRAKRKNPQYDFILKMYYEYYHERKGDPINKKKRIEGLKNRKSVFEGVGDKYAAKKWHIPDPDEELEREYDAELLRENPKIKIIHNFPKGSMIIKNPPSLANIAFNVRGVISKTGDIYIQNYPFETHAEMIDALAEKGEIKVVNEWWKKLPSEFLTITRFRKTNSFVIGESNDLLYQDNDRSKPVEIPDIYKKFMSLAKRKHPQYNFVPKHFEKAVTRGTEIK